MVKMVSDMKRLNLKKENDYGANWDLCSFLSFFFSSLKKNQTKTEDMNSPRMFVKSAWEGDPRNLEG